MAKRGSTGGIDGSKAQLVHLMLRAEIFDGTYGAGRALPSEAHLADRFGVARTTVRRAVDLLVADGLAERRARVGTLVLHPDRSSGRVQVDFSALMPGLHRMGAETTVRLLQFDYVPVPEPVARMLRMDPGGRVQRAVRVRSANGVPFSYLVTHVPDDIGVGYSEKELATVPLFRLLERTGHRLDHASQTMTATLAGPEEVAALQVGWGAPLLKVTRVLFERGGRGVEHLTALYRPDLFALTMRLDHHAGAGDEGHWAPALPTAAA